MTRMWNSVENWLWRIPLLSCGVLSRLTWTRVSMASRFGFVSLLPLGLTADTVVDNDRALVVAARSDATTAIGPLCGASDAQS